MLTEELGDQMHQNQLAAAENTQRAQEVERKRGEVAQVRKELARVTKLKDATAKMMTGIEADKEKGGELAPCQARYRSPSAETLQSCRL